MPPITDAASMSETTALLDANDCAEIEDEGLAATAVAVAHPCARHEMDVPEVWTAVAEPFRPVRRFDVAIAAYEAASGHRRRDRPGRASASYAGTSLSAILDPIS